MPRLFENYVVTAEELPLRSRLDIIASLGQLSLPVDRYFILGGANLVLRGIKDTTPDLDMLVDDQTFEALQLLEGAEIKAPPLPAVSRGAVNTTVWVKNHETPIPVSATTSLGDGYYPMSFTSHRDKVELVDGFPCILLDEVIAAKAALQRTKDLIDLWDIESFTGILIDLPAQSIAGHQFDS